MAFVALLTSCSPRVCVCRLFYGYSLLAVAITNGLTNKHWGRKSGGKRVRTLFVFKFVMKNLISFVYIE